MSKNAPFKFDIVGSFLRPDYLKKARKDYSEGKINNEELKNIEDKAIVELIEKQKKVGLPVITDGEFRRSSWHLDFMWAFNGVGHEKTKDGIPFDGEAALIDDTFLIGEVSVNSHPFVEHFKFVKQFEDDNTALNLAFTGAIKDEIMDIEELALKLVERLQNTYGKELKERYKLNEIFENPIDTLDAIGKKRGTLISGGQIDYNRLAVILLDEFRGGKIGKISLESPLEENNEDN